MSTPPSSEPSKDVPSDVLIVDDELAIGRVLARALRKRGLTVVAVTSTLHAIRVLSVRPFHVVLSDQRMPGPAGAELLSYVERYWPASRRVLMSAWIDSSMIKDCPCHRVIDKSFPLALIVEVIMEEVLRAQGSQPRHFTPRSR